MSKKLEQALVKAIDEGDLNEVRRIANDKEYKYSPHIVARPIISSKHYDSISKAIHYNNIPVLQILYDAGIDLSSYGNDKNDSLYYAISRYQSNSAHFLIDNNCFNKEKIIPAFRGAISASEASIFNKLLPFMIEADLLNELDGYDRNLVYLAARSGDKYITETLINLGVEIKPALIELKKYSGCEGYVSFLENIQDEMEDKLFREFHMESLSSASILKNIQNIKVTTAFNFKAREVQTVVNDNGSIAVMAKNFRDFESPAEINEAAKFLEKNKGDICGWDYNPANKSAKSSLGLNVNKKTALAK